MPVENISQSSQESVQGAKAGFARNALGWLHRVISDSVRDINEFAAMLSVESVASSPSRAGPESANENPTFEIDDGQSAVLESQDSAVMAIQTDGSKTDSVSFNNPVQAAGSGSELLSAEVSVEEPLRNVVMQFPADDHSADPDPLENHENTEEIHENPEAAQAIEQQIIVSDNAVATEIAVSQLIPAGPTAQPPSVAINADESSSVEEKSASQEISQNSVLPVSADATSELQQDDVEKSLVEFARTAVQKEIPEKASLKTGQNEMPAIPAADKSRSELPELVFAPDSKNPDSAGGPHEEIILNQNFQQTNTNLPTSRASGVLNSGFSEFFVSNWMARYSAESLSASEHGLRLGIDMPKEFKGVASLPRSTVEQENSFAINAKGLNPANSLSERQAAGIALNSAEPGQKAEAGKNLKPLTRLQSLATMERVEAALQKAAESKDGTVISLRLDPPSLGTVKVDVSFREGMLHARLSADSAQVLSLLREKAPELQVVLRKLGLDVDRVSVSVNSGGFSSFNEDSQERQGKSGQKGGNFFSGPADSADLKDYTNLDHWIA